MKYTGQTFLSPSRFKQLRKPRVLILSQKRHVVMLCFHFKPKEVHWGALSPGQLNMLHLLNRGRGDKSCPTPRFLLQRKASRFIS